MQAISFNVLGISEVPSIGRNLMSANEVGYPPIKYRQYSRSGRSTSLFPITYAHLFEYPLLTYNAFFQKIKKYLLY